MPKLRFSRKAVAGFFVSHVEKLVLAVVLVLSGVFIYSGYSLEGVSSQQTPVALSREVDRVRGHINGDHWENISKKHQPRTGHLERARKTQTPVGYAALKPFIPPDKPSGIRRTDPEILAPIELEVSVVVGPLALQLLDSDVDLLDDLADTEMNIKKKKKKKKSREERQAAMMALMAPDEEGPSPDELFISGGGPDIAGEGEKDLASAADRIFPGYRPPGTEALAASRVLVAVKALVPYRQQWGKFDQAFASAMHYNAGRDLPQYRLFVAERAEVPADPNAELVWKRISHSKVELSRPSSADERWAGVAGEVADPRYTSEWLTMPIPPIMMRDFADFALHSKVPRYLENDPVTAELEEEAAATAASLTELLNDPNAALGGGGGTGSFGAFGDMDEASAGSAPSASTLTVRGPQIDHLMIRFFDMTAELGKQYRYRVQVWLEDPNHPLDSRLQPQDRALSDEVRQRLAQIDKEYGGERHLTSTTLKSEFSEPTDVVAIEPRRVTLAGPIKPAGEMKFKNSPLRIPTGEPSAKLLSIVWDNELAVDVPGFVDAQRGAVLDFTQNADVIHPVTLQFKKLERYNIKTDHLLVDFRGGGVLPKVEEEQKKKRKRGKDKEDEEEEEEEKPEVELLAASEFIFLDRDGNFFVRNDLDDAGSYELYVVPEKIEEEE